MPTILISYTRSRGTAFCCNILCFDVSMFRQVYTEVNVRIRVRLSIKVLWIHVYVPKNVTLIVSSLHPMQTCQITETSKQRGVTLPVSKLWPAVSNLPTNRITPAQKACSSCTFVEIPIYPGISKQSPNYQFKCTVDIE